MLRITVSLGVTGRSKASSSGQVPLIEVFQSGNILALIATKRWTAETSGNDEAHMHHYAIHGKR